MNDSSSSTTLMIIGSDTERNSRRTGQGYNPRSGFRGTRTLPYAYWGGECQSERALAFRGNPFWSCVLDSGRERYSRHSAAEWQNEGSFEGGRRPTKGRSGTKAEMMRQNSQESEWILRTERSISSTRKERMIIPRNTSIMRRRLLFLEGILQFPTTNQEEPKSTFAQKNREIERLGDSAVYRPLYTRPLQNRFWWCYSCRAHTITPLWSQEFGH